MSVARCNLCSDEDPFRVPWDFIGAALMEDHIREAHRALTTAEVGHE